MRSAFDSVAAAYDETFTSSTIGRLQRAATHHHLRREIGQRRGLRILEINGGTGEDACWLAQLGHHVLCTDISTEMMHVARAKADTHNGAIAAAGGAIRFQTVGFSELDSLRHEGPFDLVWSNFGGLNCVAPETLATVAQTLRHLIRPSGSLHLVFLAKRCLWERLFFLWRGELSKSRRRSTPTDAFLDSESTQRTWYYSTAELRDLFQPLRCVGQHGIGLFVAPSYLESWWIRHPLLTRILVALDRWISPLSVTADLADHAYLSFALSSSPTSIPSLADAPLSSADERPKGTSLRHPLSTVTFA